MKKLKKLDAWSFAGETLELPSGLESLEEIDLDGSEQLKRPDWLSKIDSETVEIILPDHPSETSN